MRGKDDRLGASEGLRCINAVRMSAREWRIAMYLVPNPRASGSRIAELRIRNEEQEESECRMK